MVGRKYVEQNQSQKSDLDWQDLSVGDYVVHVNHGIGQFMGIKNKTVDNASRD